MDKRILGRAYSRLIHKYFLNDLYFDLRLRARADTVDYIEANLKDAMLCSGRQELIELCMRREKTAGLGGLILEFGVAAGVSTRAIAGCASPRIIHGFDSFEGLPSDWSGTGAQRGSYSQHGKTPRLPTNVRLHQGWFNQTLPAFLAEHSGPVSFVNIDCDVYDSTIYVLNQLQNRLRVGTVILFDEYYNYPNWREHEYRAWQEFVAVNDIGYSYAGFSTMRYHAAVQIKRIGKG
ncbi:MAG: class I SAM-dependent methyltransferase [Alphaproteobacteria bacterium]|nr:class I SAM-dependent methyltransferase [Alphaproteobacteria bacterium]